MTIRLFHTSTPLLAPSAYVDSTAVVIGDVHVGADASLWPTAVARGDIGSIRIGARTNIQDGSILHVTHVSDFFEQSDLYIGDEVTVGHRVVLHGCTVSDRCLIGMGSVVMDGAVLGEYTLLGAGALVTPGQQLEGGHLWVGSPARRARRLRDDERAYIDYSAQHYVDLKNSHIGANE